MEKYYIYEEGEIGEEITALSFFAKNDREAEFKARSIVNSMSKLDMLEERNFFLMSHRGIKQRWLTLDGHPCFVFSDGKGGMIHVPSNDENNMKIYFPEFYEDS